MEVIDLLPGARLQRDHRAIARARDLIVERLANPQRHLPRAAIFIVAPADPPFPVFARRVATLHADRMEYGVVEEAGLVQVRGTKADVGKHGMPPRFLNSVFRQVLQYLGRDLGVAATKM